MTREVKRKRWREWGEGRSYKTEKIEEQKGDGTKSGKEEMRRVKETLENEETKNEKEQQCETIDEE